MKSFKELQRERARFRQKETKEIESYLHPNPEPINGVRIGHIHERGSGKLTFMPFDKMGMLVSNKVLTYSRVDVLNIGKHFYNHEMNNFKWLCTVD